MLLEILVALSSSKDGREYLRKIQAYQVVKKLHLVERNEDVLELAEEIANLLMRDEAEDLE